MVFVADIVVVSTKLRRIEEYYNGLQAIEETLTKERFLTTKTEQWTVECLFDRITQTCTELAQHIVRSDFDWTEDCSMSAAELLHQHGVLNRETMEALKMAANSTSVLADGQQYADYERLYSTLRYGLDVYDEFSQQIALWVRDSQLVDD